MYFNWSKIEPVLKGWSEDKKFYIEDNLGENFLLKLSDLSKYEVKRLEYNYIKKVAALGITTSKPVDFGISSNNGYVYSLFTWVEGEEAELVLSKYSEKEQYNIGLRAGNILQKIHTINDYNCEKEWSEKYKQKIYKKIEQYGNSPIKFENDSAFINYIKENISYLDNRPQTFLHGDYHVGNLIISPKRDVGVIDFNRMDIGDPWEEFNRCVFSCRVSIPFVIGQIHGYFDCNVPDEFFRLMALYIATNTISSIPWAIPFGEVEIKYMMDNAKKVFEWYDGFKTYIPLWYREY
ncbi:aminoglycoside phosphotransferase family protein [Clostridium malenominatum]|uniref:aminoglycoside phosphotransferase family protein n=1 Tax=Clostridium malenominatum TaxID=1539 RepID=UPI0031DAFF44